MRMAAPPESGTICWIDPLPKLRVPTIVAAAPEDQQVRGARVRREADLRNAIKPGNGAARPAVGEEAASGAIDPFVLGTEQDAQLTRALEVLRTRPLRSRG